MSLAQEIHSGLLELTGQEPAPAQLDALDRYLGLLESWNKTYNLTAVRDRGQMVTRHLLDSISILPFISSTRLLDAGTGAGLPGIPLAIYRPELELILLDSAGKKIRFLNHVCRELELTNVTTVQARLESFSPEQPFDEIVSRAFSSLATFAGAARHLAPTRLLAMKGRYPAAEIDELPNWVKVQSVEKLRVPGLKEERHLVIMSVSP